MPAENFGISFMPGAEGENGQQQTAEPLQEAVKLLNLRLPSVVGARSPIHPSLLQATGLQGQPDAMFLNALRMLGVPPSMPQPGGTSPSSLPANLGPLFASTPTTPGVSTPGLNQPPSSLLPLPASPRVGRDPFAGPESRGGPGGVTGRMASARRSTPRFVIEDPNNPRF